MSKHFFPESSHVANQRSIEHNASINSVLTHTLVWGQRSKHFFSERSHVAYQINIKGMENRAPCKHIVGPYTYPKPVGWI